MQASVRHELRSNVHRFADSAIITSPETASFPLSWHFIITRNGSLFSTIALLLHPRFALTYSSLRSLKQCASPAHFLKRLLRHNLTGVSPYLPTAWRYLLRACLPAYNIVPRRLPPTYMPTINLRGRADGNIRACVHAGAIRLARHPPNAIVLHTRYSLSLGMFCHFPYALRS